jgi:hypothetical protein
MKFVATFLFLACGFFLSMFVIQQVAGWDQSLRDIAFTSLIFGVLGTPLAHFYLRYSRKNKSG